MKNVDVRQELQGGPWLDYAAEVNIQWGLCSKLTGKGRNSCEDDLHEPV